MTETIFLFAVITHKDVQSAKMLNSRIHDLVDVIFFCDITGHNEKLENLLREIVTDDKLHDSINFFSKAAELENRAPGLCGI